MIESKYGYMQSNMVDVSIRACYPSWDAKIFGKSKVNIMRLRIILKDASETRFLVAMCTDGNIHACNERVCETKLLFLLFRNEVYHKRAMQTILFGK